MSWETNDELSKAQAKKADAEAKLLKAIGGKQDVIDAYQEQHRRAMEILGETLDRAIEEQKGLLSGKIRGDDSSWAGVAHVVSQMYKMEQDMGNSVDSPKTMKLVSMFIHAVVGDETINRTVEIIEDGTTKP